MKLEKFDWCNYYLESLKHARTKDEVIEIRDKILYYDQHDLDKWTMFRLGELIQMYIHLKEVEQ